MEEETRIIKGTGILLQELLRTVPPRNWIRKSWRLNHKIVKGIDADNGTQQSRPDFRPLDVVLGESPRIGQGQINHIALGRVRIIDHISIDVEFKCVFLPAVLRHQKLFSGQIFCRTHRNHIRICIETTEAIQHFVSEIIRKTGIGPLAVEEQLGFIVDTIGIS